MTFMHLSPYLFNHIKKKPSLSSQPNSNLEVGIEPLMEESPIFKNKGVWSEISLVKAWTMV